MTFLTKLLHFLDHLVMLMGSCGRKLGAQEIVISKAQRDQSEWCKHGVTLAYKRNLKALESGQASIVLAA